MHPWHDYPIDEASVAQWFPAIVEVPMGSKNKYELDKVSGLLRLDRVLYSDSAFHRIARVSAAPGLPGYGTVLGVSGAWSTFEEEGRDESRPGRHECPRHALGSSF